MDTNTVILTGRLTREPEGRRTTSGVCVVEFSIAVNGGKEKVSFIDVTAWEKTADNVRDYVRKGDPVLVEGSITQDTWEDKQTGQKRSKLKVTAYRVQFLKSRSDANSERQPQSGYVRQDRPQNVSPPRNAPPPPPIRPTHTETRDEIPGLETGKYPIDNVPF